MNICLRNSVDHLLEFCSTQKTTITDALKTNVDRWAGERTELEEKLKRATEKNDDLQKKIDSQWTALLDKLADTRDKIAAIDVEEAELERAARKMTVTITLR